MGAMASHIASFTIVYSIAYSGAVQRKHQRSASLAFFVRGITGEFPAQRASNADNVSIWWRHHVTRSQEGAIAVSRNDGNNNIQPNFLITRFDITRLSALSISRGIFPHKSYKWSPIARPLRRGMRCFLWLLNLNKILAFSLSYCV